MRTLIGIYFFLIGLCFGSFALATAWRIKKKKDFTRERSECEYCHHTLSARDLIPLYSWLSLGGKCRYCRKKLSRLMPLAELTGGIFLVASYLFWPVQLVGFNAVASFVVWCLGLILLLILFFYDLQWFLLPNKVMHPLWAVASVSFLLRFLKQPTLHTLLLGIGAVAIAAGLFLAIWLVSKGSWIGFGDVRLGLAIGLFVGTPLLATLVIFAASVIGVIFALPLLVTRNKKLNSKLPFGPLLILALVLVQLFGQRAADWYAVHLLFL